MKSKLSVLLVDDDDDMRAYLATVLETSGGEVHGASSGREALRLLSRGFSADVVFLDCEMPELSGEETLRAVRQRWPSLPVVMWSSDMNATRERRLLKAGAVMCTHKPELQSLLSAVFRFAARHADKEVHSL